MALININKLRRTDKNRNNIHNEVHSSFTIFEKNGDKYFQLDTYGSEFREMPEKVSQSIQLNYETAKFLVDLLKKEYKIK